MARWDPEQALDAHRAAPGHLHDRTAHVLRVAARGGRLLPRAGEVAAADLEWRRRRHAGLRSRHGRAVRRHRQAHLRLDRGPDGHDQPRRRRSRPSPRHRRAADGNGAAAPRAGRRGVGARARAVRRATPTRRAPPTSSSTAGSAPATSATSTPTDGSPSSGASRTSSSAAGRTSPPPRSKACSRPTPRSRQAAVVGQPDERLGEQVCAFVVCAPGADARPRRVPGVVRRARASPDSRPPRSLEVVDELPLLAAGKVDRAELRRRAESG